MLQYNDIVVFNRNFDTKTFRCISDQFNYYGTQCVILDNYSGEVNVDFLEKVSQLSGDKYEIKLGENIYFVMERIHTRARKEVFRSRDIEYAKKVCLDLNDNYRLEK